MNTSIRAEEIKSINPKFNIVPQDSIKIYEVLATKYNPVALQCDQDPLITADNSNIDLKSLNNYDLKWIAVSRDLLNEFQFGDTVHIRCNNPLLEGKWVIHDVMNKRFKNRIDFLVPINDKYNFNEPIKVNLISL